MSQLNEISIGYPVPATLMDRRASAPNSSCTWDLVLAGSVADPTESDFARMRRLLEKAVDWEAVLRLADEHGTSSLIYRNFSQLGDAVAGTTMEVLRQRYERNVHKSLFLARELIRILDCAHGLGMEVMPYKGAVLAEAYYGDMAMRPSGDMDLFVRKRDVTRLKNAVRELGYTTRVNIPEAAEEDYLESGYECTFDSPAGKNLLELQWALQPRFYAVDFDMEAAFERAVEATVAGRGVKTPSAEDMLLILCVHAAKHVWGRLIWLCDIAQIAKRRDLDWEWARRRARELGIARLVNVSFLLAQTFLLMQIPRAIEQEVVGDDEARAIAEEIAGGLARGEGYDELGVSYFRLMMRLRERRMDRARFLTRLAFTPGPGEWEAVQLPRAFSPLYRVVRMGRLVARLGRGV